MAGIFFIIFIIGVIIYCLYKVHSKRVFNIYEPFCSSCKKIFDVEYTCYPYCPDCHTKIIWRRKAKNNLLKNLKDYREKRGRTK